jgi:heterodisulfide reductase subunit C
MMTTEVFTTRIVEELKNIIGVHKPEFCYQCAKCTSGCTANKVFSEYRPHEFVALANMGYVEEILKSGVIWACTECWKCGQYCPQEVAPVEVIIALKNLSIIKGYAPPKALVEMTKNVIEKGLIQDINQVMTKDFEFIDRDSLGLPPLEEPPQMDKHRNILSKFFGVVMK